MAKAKVATADGEWDGPLGEVIVTRMLDGLDVRVRGVGTAIGSKDLADMVAQALAEKAGKAHRSLGRTRATDDGDTPVFDERARRRLYVELGIVEHAIGNIKGIVLDTISRN